MTRVRLLDTLEGHQDRGKSTRGLPAPLLPLTSSSTRSLARRMEPRPADSGFLLDRQICPAILLRARTCHIRRGRLLDSRSFVISLRPQVDYPDIPLSHGPIPLLLSNRRNPGNRLIRLDSRHLVPGFRGRT